MPDVPQPSVATEIVHVTERTVACDGGEGALGHPRVWLRILDHDVVCPYCSRQFILDASASASDSH